MADLPAYATREDVKKATDYGSVSDARIDRTIFARSRLIDETLNRHFYPLTAAVIYSEYDASFHVSDTAFWLNRDLQSVTGITVDGTSETTYTLLPKNGPPYNRLAIDSYWNVDTIITGVWGFTADTAPAGALAAAVASTTATTVTCSDASLVGVGDLILVNSEQLLVTGKAAADTTANLNGALTASMANATVTVTDGTLVKTGEMILVESERMQVTDITGNDLTVTRAVDGSTLAAHDTAKDVYAYRTLTVVRGVVGSTAATHADTDALVKNVPPEAIRQWVIAESINTIEQETSGYARVVGAGDNQREPTGKALGEIQKDGKRYIRQRMSAV